MVISDDVSGQRIGHILRGQEFFSFEFLNPEDGTDRLTSLRNYHYSPRNNPEERCSQLLPGGNLNSRKFSSNSSQIVGIYLASR
jgi:hypothetical protein